MLKTTKLEKENILMVFVYLSSFTKRDIEILKKKYQVDSYQFNPSKKYLIALTFIKQLFFLARKIHSFNVIICQSSGYHSILPVIFGKIFNIPVVIIAIGTDCIKLPEINYGAHRKKILSWVTNFSFNNSKLILPVHKSLINSEYNYQNVKYKNQGIRAFNKDLKTEIIELVNGYDTKKWVITNKNRIKNSFLTVAAVIDETRYYVKGIDLIVKIAEKFPEYRFTIVGELLLKETFPKNITFIDQVTQNELVNIYNNHEFYLQLSMTEGFPNALCEAMLCGCIPIGSNVAGIPDIIGKYGYILYKKDFNDLIALFIKLNKNTISSNQVREQICNNFAIAKREKEIHALLKELK